MITLKDSIEIMTTTDKLYNWLMNLDKNFTRWHPNHKKFEKVTGGNNVGDIVRFEQRVSGVLYDIKGEIIIKEKNEDNFKIVFKTMSGIGRISFISKATENGCIFTHIEEFGIDTPVVGNIVNFLLFKVFAREKANWDIILQDMKEDNVNLKKIMESKNQNTSYNL
jgi:hypothetical protein